MSAPVAPGRVSSFFGSLRGNGRLSSGSSGGGGGSARHVEARRTSMAQMQLIGEQK